MSSNSPEKSVRFGVIGAGGMGQAHCAGFAKYEEGTLSAVCDINPEVAHTVGSGYKTPSFTDYKKLIKSKLCDAVIIATPHPQRPQIALDCMKAGLHVLSEKPLSERVSTADKMIETAKQTGVAFGVMFQRRTEPAFAKAIEIIKSGQIGKVYRATLISPEFRSQTYYDSASWRATWVGEGGGVMMNQSPHVLDLFILLGGKPSAVLGKVETRLHNIEVEDHAEALLTYPDGGTGYLVCSTCEAGNGQMIEVFGDRGKLTYRDGSLTMETFDVPIEQFTKTTQDKWAVLGSKTTVVELDDVETGHYVITRNFARHILYGDPLISPGEEGLYSLELANAVWLSAHLGKEIKLPISRKAYDRFLSKKRKGSTFKKMVKSVNDETDPQHRIKK